MSDSSTVPLHYTNRLIGMPSRFANRSRVPSAGSNVMDLESSSDPGWQLIGRMPGDIDTRPIDEWPQIARVGEIIIVAISRQTGGSLGEEYSSSIQYSPPNLSPEMSFRCLASIWKGDTNHLSDLTQICNHWAYQQIVNMGNPVIPLLLRELETRPDYWFSALRKLTGENPVPPEARGKLKDMASAWLEWGRRNDISW